MSLRADDAGIGVSWDGTELFRYAYRTDDPPDESPRPYLHPVRTLAGELVTDFRPDDHPWHKGIAWSWPNVGTENFWGGPTYRRGDGYVQLDNNGAIEHESFELARVSDGVARLTERLRWVTAAGQTWFAERRRMAVTAWPDAWTCAFETTLRNVSGRAIRIGSPTTEGRDNAGYGGLFWRGPRSFTGGRVLTPDGTGRDELMGWRGPWLAFAGPTATLIFADSPGNAGFPGQWFVRSSPFACVCPAPFFATAHSVPSSAAITLRYDLVVADGELDTETCARLLARKEELLCQNEHQNEQW
jgi:hypothetical protein